MAKVSALTSLKLLGGGLAGSKLIQGWNFVCKKGRYFCEQSKDTLFLESGTFAIFVHIAMANIFLDKPLYIGPVIVSM